MTRQLIGYGVTDGNGVATLNYTGQGVGGLSISVETGGEVLFHYFGVGGTETDFWTGQSGNNAVSQSSTTTGTTFTSTGSATGFIWANLQGQTPSTLEGIFTGDMTVEFDVVSTTGTVQMAFYETYQSGVTVNSQRWELSTGHWKIARSGSTFAVDHDGTTSTATKELAEPLRIGFVVASGKAVTFKNFFIYREDANPLISDSYNLLDCIFYDDMETTTNQNKYARDNTATISYSTEWAKTGSKSMKWNKQSGMSGNALYWGIVFIANPTLSAFDIDLIKGKMLQLKVTTKTDTSTQSENFTINSYVKTTTNTSWAGVGTAQTVQTGENTYTINYQIPDNATQWWLRFGQNGSGAKVLYVDNWKLYPI